MVVLFTSYASSNSLNNGSTPFQVNLLNDDTYSVPMELCDVILQTNRGRCALNMEILDLLNEESVSGARSGRASL